MLTITRFRKKGYLLPQILLITSAVFGESTVLILGWGTVCTWGSFNVGWPKWKRAETIGKGGRMPSPDAPVVRVLKAWEAWLFTFYLAEWEDSAQQRARHDLMQELAALRASLEHADGSHGPLIPPIDEAGGPVV